MILYQLLSSLVDSIEIANGNVLHLVWFMCIFQSLINLNDSQWNVNMNLEDQEKIHSITIILLYFQSSV